MPTSPSDPRVYGLAVIGAGPAGLAAAVTAAELGVSVALLDAGEQTGGQYYRHPSPGLGATRPEALHHDWGMYTALRDRLRAGGATHLPGHHVWTLTRQPEDADAPFTVHAVLGEDGRRPVAVRARTVLLATGAYERQLPFPGWTLPGVVTAGGAQAMLKSGLVLPGRRIVVAGSGPLLLAVAASLASAGARVPALVEAAGYPAYARRPDVLAAVPGKAAEAMAYGAALLRHRVPVRTRSAVTRVHGTDRVEAVTVTRLDGDWRPVPGSGRRIECDALAVGHGLVPHIDLATALGCATRRTPDGTTALDLDGEQRTSVPGLWAAGETGGVGGVRLALLEGEIAGAAVAARVSGRTLAGARVRRLGRGRARLRAFAGLMARVHAPRPGWTGWLDDGTDVCRCEEVTAGRVREAVAGQGAGDARTVKLLTRAGMGWCQGRMCGTAVACLAAESRPGLSPEGRAQTAVPREARPPEPAPPARPLPPSPERRPLATPVTLAALAEAAGPDDHSTSTEGFPR
ncbi:NAD(P)/FAD-dependent oxidoreductase [Streptomyces sp. NPDC058739]|uniref:FAD/NAD(P)-dependent oxidoreductase n=1 Tax=Streptomyces sp. NPDC058739 TaxID=3346618 RepID=UPI003693488C